MYHIGKAVAVTVGCTALIAGTAATASADDGGTATRIHHEDGALFYTLQLENGGSLTDGDGEMVDGLHAPTGIGTTTTRFGGAIARLFDLQLNALGGIDEGQDDSGWSMHIGDYGQIVTEIDLSKNDGPSMRDVVGVSMADLYKSLSGNDTTYDFLAGIYGTVSDTVSYSGDSFYGASQTGTYTVTLAPPEGTEIPDIDLTASIGSGDSLAVRASLPQVDSGDITFTCTSIEGQRDYIDAINNSDVEDWPDTDSFYQRVEATVDNDGAADATCDNDGGDYFVAAQYMGDGAGYAPIYTAIVASGVNGGTNAGIDNANAIPQGATAHTSITGLEPNTDYDYEYNSTSFCTGSGTSDSNGTLTIECTIPEDLEDGTHHVNVRDGAGNTVASIPFDVSYLGENTNPTISGAATSGGDGASGDGDDTPGDGDDEPGNGGNTGPSGSASLNTLFSSLGS